jgi:L-2,4-diaminobutyrate transaminase
MPQSDVVGFAPPLCLTRAEADIIVDAARRAIDKVVR